MKTLFAVLIFLFHTNLDLGDTITIFSIHEYFGSDYSMAMRKYFRQHYHDSSFKVRDRSAEWDRVKQDILHI